MIELTASYRNEDQPDFEQLNVDPTKTDMDQSAWESLWVNPDLLCTAFKNSAGYTNITLLNGEKWSVKETPEEIAKLKSTQNLLLCSQ